MRAPIHSQKHYVQMSRSTVTTGTRVLTTLIQAREGTVASGVDEVIEGAIVKAIYIELWLIGSMADQYSIVTLTKEVGANVGPTFTEMVGLGIYTNKKNILFTHQGLAGNDGISIPLNIMRGWYKIPKSKQRFGLGDSLRLAIASQGDATIFFCGFATYKEYT